MAQVHQILDVEKSGAPLYRMESAKNGVQQLLVIGTLLQLHEFAVHIGQELACLCQEVFKQLLHALKVTHRANPFFLEAEALQQIIDLRLAGDYVCAAPGVDDRAIEKTARFGCFAFIGWDIGYQ